MKPLPKHHHHHPSTSHSLSPSPHSNQGPYSAHSLSKQPHTNPHPSHSQQFDSQTYEFNFKVLSRQSTLRNIQKILFTLSFANLAKYQVNGDYWNYLKVKGPMFVVVDKYGQVKMAILNQCSTENQIIHIQKDMKFELKKLPNDSGYMLNYCIEDSITGKSIYGIWTADKAIEKVWHHLEKYMADEETSGKDTK